MISNREWAKLFVRIRRLGLTTTGIISAVGMISIFSVHLAGFLLHVPNGLRQLVDAASVVNLSTKLVITSAFALFGARFAPVLPANILIFVIANFTLARLLCSRTGRRYLRIQGESGFLEYAGNLLRAKDKGGIDTEGMLKWLDSVKAVRFYGGISYVRGRVSGAIVYHTERYEFLIQAVAVLYILSFNYVSLSGAAIVISLVVLLIFF